MGAIADHIAIIGVGLIGGSLAQVIKKKKLAGKITGYGRNTERLKKARSMGLIDGYSVDFQAGLETADMVVIGTPVGIIVEQALAIAAHVKPRTIITDVGSVKGKIVMGIESHLPEDVYFIGGHPIAGTENSGFEASFAELFENRVCVLTPTDSTQPEAIARVKQLWSSAGSTVICMDMDTHDKIFAAISHLPHMVAFSLVNAVVDMKDFAQNIIQYSAGGFKDFTRIAASDPVMWRDVALMNRDNLLKTIDFFSRSLDELKDAITHSDGTKLEALFKRSRDTRRTI